MPTPNQLEQLRNAIQRIERNTQTNPRPPLPFGIPQIDQLIDGGIARGALHEIAGTGADIHHGAAASRFAAGILARLQGPILWVLEPNGLTPKIFEPGLAAAGLHPDRVLYAQAEKTNALLVTEEGLRHPGLAAVATEFSGRIGLTASRRLQLAAEATGVTALLIRRPLNGQTELAGALAAVTRWRIGPLPSAPPIPEAPDIPGLGRARWQVDLLRARNGRTGSWIMEACDEEGRLDLVAPLAHRPPAQDRTQRAA